MIYLKLTGRLVLVAFFAILLQSCGSRREMVYANNIQDKAYEQVTQYEPVLQPDDLLTIQVLGENQEVTVPFNLPEMGQNDSEYRNIRTYLIDNQGYIDFPVLGRVKLSGLTRTEAREKLVKMLSEYIVNPTVNFRIVNYKVSVLGEVLRPGNYNSQGERITLLEALGLAGDLTIYGRRDNILLIRETEGKKEHTRINLADAGFIDSPYYYLKQNDIIYVEPNKTKIHTSRIGPDIYLIFSGISVLTTLFV
ncbi:MAG TPA: polysaccharide biosynthesis/export family protein, partial [Flavobacterium sp.]|nr:polysaccharide biosynthesis/export family protein [Flavobacterium sp.]